MEKFSGVSGVEGVCSLGAQALTRMQRELRMLETEPPPGVSAWPTDENRIDKVSNDKKNKNKKKDAVVSLSFLLFFLNSSSPPLLSVSERTNGFLSFFLFLHLFTSRAACAP